MTTNTTLKALLPLLLSAMAAACAAAAGRLSARHISTADGLPSNNINCIAQDADGFIWFGTANGLCRFDGYSTVNFENLSPDAGEPTDRHIGSIDVTDSTLVATTSNSARATYSLAKSRFTSYALPDGRQPAAATLGGRRVLARASLLGDTFVVTEGMVSRLARGGRVVRTYRLPPAAGRAGRVEFCFAWGNRLAIATARATIVLDPATGAFDKPAEAQVAAPVHQCSTPGREYVSNGSGDLWVFTHDGTVSRLRLLPGAPYAQTRRHQFYAADDGRGHVAIATFGGGLYVLDKATGRLSHHSAADTQPIIPSDFLTCAMADRDGNVWIGSEAAGAVCLSAGPPIATRYLYPKPGDRDETANHIYALAGGPGGSILAATRQNELVAIGTGERAEARAEGKWPAPAFALLTDSRGRRWAGTRGAGLFVDGRNYRSGSAAHPLPSDNIYALAEAPRGTFWIATWGGGLLRATLDPGGELDYEATLNSTANERRVRCLAVAADGTLWAGTDNGLYSLPAAGHAKGLPTPAGYNLQNHRLRGNEVTTMHYSRRSGLWIGLRGHGLACCKVSGGRLDSVRYFDAAHGLACNIVSSIAEDGHGNIWAATEEGISCVIPATLAVATFRLAPSPMGNVFTENSSLAAPDGRLYFGSRRGILEITPAKDPTAQASAKCALTDIRINGASALTMQGGHSPLEASLQLTRQLRLDHTENSLSIYFSDFNYPRPQSTLYQYMLEGADEGWSEPTTQNHADYGNLPPGSYTFRLRKYTPGGDSPETTLAVAISPPWHTTWWAWCLYAAAALSAGFGLWRGWLARFRLRRKMEIERSLNDFRLNFFTHIAHEFRTPLAIIKSATDKIAQADGPAPGAAVAAAARGTRRLSRLVDRLMEFRKLNADGLRLCVWRGDVVAFVRNVADDFLPMARQKGISLTFTPFSRSFAMPFDRHIVESIVGNLLSNAIKYTPQRGAVELKATLAEGGGTLVLQVADTGPGIPPERQAHLFEPFMHGYVSQGGMGIGLFLAKRMAELHHGSLAYAPGPGGRGSTFTACLPATDSAYAPGEVRPAAIDGAAQPGSHAAEPPIEAASAINDIRIALVEDDPDMMEELRGELANYFKVDAYMDGAEAAEGIVASPPGLVVCDVMLPGISGYDVVARLRANAATKRLPVIMLTALDDEEHQIKAYRAGADDYMVKPCNLRVLLARAARLIKWSGQPDPQPGEQAQGGKPGAVLTSQADKLFVGRMDALIAAHIADEGFGVDTLAELMHTGRTKLYGRVRELTGVSPAKYIMKARMETAARLLAEGELNVGEVGMKVGFGEPSGFYKSFKNYYGVAPSKYGKQPGGAAEG